MNRLLILIIASLFFLTIPPTNVESEVWENQYGKLEVWPDTSTNIIRQTQYCNLTSYIDDTDIDVTFRFPFAIGNPDIWMWKNISHDINIPDYGMIESSYTLDNITSFELTDEPEYVNFGDIPSNNYAIGNATYSDGMGTHNGVLTIGFDSFEWLNPEHTKAKFYYEYYGVVGYHIEVQWWYDWSNIKHIFNHLEHNNQHYYYVRHWLIKNQEYKFKWQYDIPLGSSGKWDLLAKKSSDPIGTWRVQIDPWWNSNWESYRTITIDSSFLDNVLTNFPMLVAFDNSSLHIGHNRSIRFTAGANSGGTDNATEYPYEIELWDDTGDCFVWVNVSTIYAATDTVFNMYYNNSAATDNQNPIGVWDGYFRNVHHMDDGADVSHTSDSTRYWNNGTKKAANEPIEAVGKIGRAQTFDGVNDYINCGDPADGSLDFGTNPFTISAWIKIGELDGYVVTKASEWTVGYIFLLSGAGVMRAWVNNNGDNMAIRVDDNTWRYVVFTRAITVGNVYVNTTLDPNAPFATSGASVSTIKPFYMGRQDSGGANWFDGTMDEIQISSINRNHSWINASYNSQNQTTGFMTIGNQQFRPCTNQTFSNPNPANGSVANPIAFTWNITIENANGEEFQWWINVSSGDTSTASAETNGSKTITLAGLDYSTSYTVWVNTTNNCSNWTNETFTFTTRAAPTTADVNFTSPYPTNQSTNICPCCGGMGFNVTQANGYNMNVTIYHRHATRGGTYHPIAQYLNITNGSYGFCMEGPIFSPAYMFSHTNYTNATNPINTWNTVEFNLTGHRSKNIDHSITTLNDTFHIKKTGEYKVGYQMMFVDSTANPDSDVTGRILRNGVELHGSLSCKHMQKKDAQISIASTVMEELFAGDKITFAYTGTATTISLQSVCVVGDVPYSSAIRINRINDWGQHPMVFNETYEWYINASLATNASLYSTSAIYEFTTAENLSDCICLNSTSYDTLGGGISYAWLVGIIIVFSMLPLALIEKRRRRL